MVRCTGTAVKACGNNISLVTGLSHHKRWAGKEGQVLFKKKKKKKLDYDFTQPIYFTFSLNVFL